MSIYSPRFHDLEGEFYRTYPNGVYLFYMGDNYHQILMIKHRCKETKTNCYFPWRYMLSEVKVSLSLD